MTSHSPKITREWRWDNHEFTATISCSCGWSHTITDTAPIPPPTLYRHHKTHRETT